MRAARRAQTKCISLVFLRAHRQHQSARYCFLYAQPAPRTQVQLEKVLALRLKSTKPSELAPHCFNDGC